MRVALLFIDGVGVGTRDPDFNPLARGQWLLSQFEDGSGSALPEGGRTLLETTFGVPGRPQSATNQTAILTGEPAPRLVGKRLVAGHRRATFVNGYHGAYLKALGLPHLPAGKPEVEIPERARRRLKPSSTTLAFAAGEVPL